MKFHVSCLNLHCKEQAFRVLPWQKLLLKRVTFYSILGDQSLWICMLLTGHFGCIWLSHLDHWRSCSTMNFTFLNLIKQDSSVPGWYKWVCKWTMGGSEWASRGGATLSRGGAVLQRTFDAYQQPDDCTWDPLPWNAWQVSSQLTYLWDSPFKQAYCLSDQAVFRFRNQPITLIICWYAVFLNPWSSSENEVQRKKKNQGSPWRVIEYGYTVTFQAQLSAQVQPKSEILCKTNFGWKQILLQKADAS